MYGNLFSGEPLSTIWLEVMKLFLMVYIISNIPVKYHCFFLTSVILNQYVSPGMQDELASEYPQTSGMP